MKQQLYGTDGANSEGYLRQRPLTFMNRRSQGTPRNIALLCGLLVALQPVHAAADSLSDSSAGGFSSGGSSALLAPALLEASGARIGTVTITNGSIFDLENPDENKALYKLANHLHVTTRPGVIEQQLLFAEGEPFSAQSLAESERILRANRYLQEVSVQPVRQENGVVDIDVTTSDVWTLMPKFKLSRSGGANNAAIGAKEMNLLGTGIAIEALYESNVDRDSWVLKLKDRNLFNSWYGLQLNLTESDDGYSRALELGKPFYSLDSRAAQGISLMSKDSIETFYERGDIAAEYRDQAKAYELYRGWSSGLRHGWTRRFTAGLAYDEHRFSTVTGSEYPVSVIPMDRQLLTPFIGFEMVQDRYEKSSNYDQINRVEDCFFGTRLSGRLGVARAGSGSDRDALLLKFGAQTGFGDAQTSSLLLATELGSRLEQGGAQNLQLGVSAKYYKNQSEHRRLYLSLGGTYGYNLDLDQFLVLGGDTGMRGYPLRFQTGDKSLLFTVEQRYFTDWYPFRLFHVGGALFFDIGRTWGNSPVADSSKELLSDVGFGLRLGSSRSGLGRVIHVDLAFPLSNSSDIDGVQFLVSTRKSF